MFRVDWISGKNVSNIYGDLIVFFLLLIKFYEVLNMF